MRSVDKLIDEQKQKRKSPAPDDDGPDEVEIMMDFPPMEAINLMGSVFDRDVAKKRGGINTAPSVFSKGAVFHVNPEDE